MENKDKNVSQNVRGNLHFLSSLLSGSESSIITISSSQRSQHIEKNNQSSYSQYFPLIRSFLVDCMQPFKAVSAYSQLLSLNIPSSNQDYQIFSRSYFNPKIFPILHEYLNRETPYNSLRANHDRILDVFYKFVFCEHGELIEGHLQNYDERSLGRWLFEEGLLKLFQKYLSTSHEYTLFLSHFMLYGIAAIFVAAISILKQEPFAPSVQEMKFVEVAYVQKYRL